MRQGRVLHWSKGRDKVLRIRVPGSRGSYLPPPPSLADQDAAGPSLASDRDDTFAVDPATRTVRTVVGDLPLSPIMDPTFWEATRRHQAPKLRNCKPQNSVERQMRANPFAKALATPVRYCAITQVRLPRFFLQEFDTIGHPETGKPWLVPHSILPDEPDARDEDEDEDEDDADSQGIQAAFEEAEWIGCAEVTGNVETSENAQDSESLEGMDGKESVESAESPEAAGEGKESTESTEAAPSELHNAQADPESAEPKLQNGEPEGAAAASPPPPPHAAPSPSKEQEPPRGQAVSVLARRDLLAAFVTKGTGLEHAARRLGGAGTTFRHLAKYTVWRRDMDSYILALLRDAAASELRYLSGLCAAGDRHYFDPCADWDEVRRKHRGNILWFGEPAATAATAAAAQPPGLFAVLDVAGYTPKGDAANYSLVVHNVPLLLGEDHARRLADEAAAFRDGSLFMFVSRRTAEVQVKLWKLHGYLSDYRCGRSTLPPRTDLSRPDVGRQSAFSTRRPQGLREGGGGEGANPPVRLGGSVDAWESNQPPLQDSY
ncbi:hypothetical protein GGS23DRAFT_558449 [Durotheca rogersii]|uniref:uncharacterized protein n=1 Tax=Durotheca rogersii TaxID=419775 RepID=UPI0022212AB5|nr:uncharacterized protein GGS23DRAFT_558449 [Durotheca rogersii]KAI5865265.1 hypothetical protein GGS23DRAFT_558449 [Durotheca rogersii]